ncbi:hypothetical protein MJH54_30640, partial [Salmonella enterica subsp. enterica serovar Montevideo]|nr:hypothetical protein [Salmonella enterica subsp. enterica serovar Montevideo]
EIRPPMALEAWCAEQDSGLKLNLHPRAHASINTLPLPVERVRHLQRQREPRHGTRHTGCQMRRQRLFRIGVTLLVEEHITGRASR